MMLVLSHYYNKNIEPLKSISRNKDNIEIVCELLRQQDGKSFNRFKNFEWYIQERTNTESWLFEAFKKIGGKPRVKAPIYFVLGNNSYLEECYGENVGIIQIPLEDIPKEDISFTLEDSMSIHVSGSDRAVFTIEMLLDYIDEQNMSLETYLEAMNRKHKYIEAQIWNDEYFEKYRAVKEDNSKTN